VLVGYFLLRQMRPNVRRPFKLPEWMKWVALAIAAVYTIIYFYGGPVYANCTCNAAGRKTLPYYFIGIVVVLAYYPLYRWRKRDDKRIAKQEAVSPAAFVAPPIAGGSDPP
jgi:amino acid transporter